MKRWETCHYTSLSALVFCFGPFRGRRLEPAQICDIFKAIILIACTWLLQFVDVSMLYHLVRGQAIIKLYIIYNMLEVRTKTLVMLLSGTLSYAAESFMGVMVLESRPGYKTNFSTEQNTRSAWERKKL